MIQVFQGGVGSLDRHTIQCLRRFHVQYCSGMVDVTLPHVVDINHEVEICIDPDYAEQIKPLFKFTSLLKELCRLLVQVPHEGKSLQYEDVPVFHDIIPTTTGLDAGTAKAIVCVNCKEAMAMVNELKKCIAGFMFYK